jgi:HEAT repeat protein
MEAIAIRQLQENKDVPGLIAALRHADRIICEEAAQALGQIGDPRAVEPLIDVLRDTERIGVAGSLRGHAASALLKIGNMQAMGALAAALQSEDAETRAAAQHAWQARPRSIPALQEKKDVPGLIEALEHDNWKVRHAAAEALGEAGDVRALLPLRKLCSGDSYEGRVVREFDDHAEYEYPVRQAAEMALQRIAARDVDVEKLLILLREFDTDMVGMALAAMDSPPVPADLLLSILSHPEQYDDHTRANAAWALGEISFPGSVGPLTDALINGTYEVWTSSEEALWKVSAKTALPLETLFALLTRGTFPTQQRAARALAEIGNSQAVGPLINRLTAKNEAVRQAAAEALGKIGAPALEPLISIMRSDQEPWERALAAYALGKIRQTKALEFLLHILLEERNNVVMRAAAKALAEGGDVRAVAALGAIARRYDVREEARRAASEALASISEAGRPEAPSSTG